MHQRPCNFLGNATAGQEELTKPLGSSSVSSLSSPSSSSSPLPSPSSLSSPLSSPPLHRHLGPLILWIASSTSVTHCCRGVSLMTGALQSASSFQSCGCLSSGCQLPFYTILGAEDDSFVFHHFFFSTSSFHLGYHPCRSGPLLSVTQC